MKKIKLNFENCFWIKELKKFEIKFEDTVNKKKEVISHNVHLIYSPNWVMKSSFALIFDKYCKWNWIEICDRIHKSNISTHQIEIDDAPIDWNSKNPNIFVVHPNPSSSNFYNPDNVSTLLVNDTLKKDYETIHKDINNKKKELIQKLAIFSWEKNINIELVLTKVFGKKLNDFLGLLEEINKEIKNNNVQDFWEIKYIDIFNKDVLDFVWGNDFEKEILEYIKIYEDLIDKSNFFEKWIFNHYYADTSWKALDKNNFFKTKKHSVIFRDKAWKENEVKNYYEYKKILEEELKSINSDDKLKRQFKKIDDKIKNEKLYTFRNLLETNPEIRPLLYKNKLEDFEKNIWKYYLKKEILLLWNLVDEYLKWKENIKKIIEDAKKEETIWESVIDLFNDRFFVPFTLWIKNKEDSVVKWIAPAVLFTIEWKEVEEKDLIDVLSQWEKRALYILNILFEIEVRKNRWYKTLLIIDDIADSFDYKNKYAIVEYLREIKETHKNDFNMIILTHNFDFYRTVKSRLWIDRPDNLHAIKTKDIIIIDKEKYQNNPFEYWKKEYKNWNIAMLVALIPFVRNLIEYTINKENEDFKKLTCILHKKIWYLLEDNITKVSYITEYITIKYIKDIFSKILDNSYIDFSMYTESDKILELIYKKWEEIYNDTSEQIDLENKIVISIAIRLKAEEYMVNKLNDNTFYEDIKKDQTRELLIELFKRSCLDKKNDKEIIKILEEVNLITPENIHINSFMYEPILDMWNDKLKELYRKVVTELK